jgi:hypothetical protein
VPLHLERQPDGTGPEHPWGRWHIADDAGAVVGLVVEEREWLGYRYGPSRYTVADNRGPVPYGARWRSEGPLHGVRRAGSPSRPVKGPLYGRRSPPESKSGMIPYPLRGHERHRPAGPAHTYFLEIKPVLCDPASMLTRRTCPNRILDPSLIASHLAPLREDLLTCAFVRTVPSDLTGCETF